jgi:DNA-binding response OmpR family regulator
MASAIGKGLREHGYTVEACERGHEGEARAVTGEYDAIILDVMLPDRDGLEVCRNLRRRKVATPILILTALSGTAETVAGLDAGADDYLAKPFEFDELIARVRALLRRGQATQSTKLSYDDLELDLSKRTARRAGHRVKLSAKEFVLLEYFVRNPDRVLSRQSIAERVWDISYEPSSNVIDVHVSSLRRKIDKEFSRPLIHTIIGTGYRFGIMDEPSAAEPGA